MKHLKQLMIILVAYLLGMILQIISFFLAPATVALALPLYKKFSLFKKNALPILSGILCGDASGIVSIIILAFRLNLQNHYYLNLLQHL